MNLKRTVRCKTWSTEAKSGELLLGYKEERHTTSAGRAPCAALPAALERGERLRLRDWVALGPVRVSAGAAASRPPHLAAVFV